MSTECSAATATPSRRSAVARRVAALCAVLLGVLVLTGCLDENGQRSYDLIHHERTSRGIHQLANDLDMNATAQGWADHLAATGRLAHSQLQMPPGATVVAENVAYASSVDRTHEALMASPGHRSNILDRRFTRVGIGATVDGQGRVWIVQLFAN